MLKTVDAWNSISEEYCTPTQEIYETDDGDIIYLGYIPDEYGY